MLPRTEHRTPRVVWTQRKWMWTFLYLEYYEVRILPWKGTSCQPLIHSELTIITTSHCVVVTTSSLELHIKHDLARITPLFFPAQVLLDPALYCLYTGGISVTIQKLLTLFSLVSCYSSLWLDPNISHRSPLESPHKSASTASGGWRVDLEKQGQDI